MVGVCCCMGLREEGAARVVGGEEGGWRVVRGRRGGGGIENDVVSEI